jgi:hypothetical protein
MADFSDGIPANGILFNEAFALLFNALCPDADELNATLNRLGQTALDRAITPESVDPEHQAFWDKWNAAHKEVEPILLEALRSGTLIARRFSSRTGLEMFVPLDYWQADLILQGEDLEYPPIYFLKSEFETWLHRIIRRDQNPGRHPIELARARRAIRALHPDGVPGWMTTTAVTKEVAGFCLEQKEIPPSYSSVQRALGRRT